MQLNRDCREAAMAEANLVVEPAKRPSGGAIACTQGQSQIGTSSTVGVVSAGQSNKADELNHFELTKFFTPSVLRLVDLKTVGTETRARLFHDIDQLRVIWHPGRPHPRLVPGCLVGIRWLGCLRKSDDGHLWISRLVPMEQPDATTNLFDTVPYEWVEDREMLERAAALWRELPVPYRHLFNAILWEGARFRRFLMGPSSIDNHHNDINGNLRHTIEVAELACALAKRSTKIASVPLATFAGLIHDVAKADEYKFNRVRGVFELSDQGTLLGHRDRLQHWIASAVAKYSIELPPNHLIGLLHALTATKGAPAHLGLREPRSVEATILTTSDRLSGETDFYRRLTYGESGFGEYHHHLRGRPFVADPTGEQ